MARCANTEELNKYLTGEEQLDIGDDDDDY